MGVQLAEPGREVALLGGREVLVLEEDHLVVEQRRADVPEEVVDGLSARSTPRSTAPMAGDRGSIWKGVPPPGLPKTQLHPRAAVKGQRRAGGSRAAQGRPRAAHKAADMTILPDPPAVGVVP